MKARVWCLVVLMGLLAGAYSSRNPDLEEEEEVAFYEDEPQWSRIRRDAQELDEEEEWVPPPRARRDADYERRRCCEYEESTHRVKRSLGPNYEVREDNGEEPQRTAPLFPSADEELTGAASEHRGFSYHTDQHRLRAIHPELHIRYAVRPEKHRSHDIRQPFGAHSVPHQAYAARPDQGAYGTHEKKQQIKFPTDEMPYAELNEEISAHTPHYEQKLQENHKKHKNYEKYPTKQKTRPYIPEKELRAFHFEKRPEAIQLEEHYHHNQEPGAPAPANYLPAQTEDPPEEDQELEGTAHHQKHSGHSRGAHGGGRANHAQHHSLNNAHGSKGYKSSEHSDKGAKGHNTKDLHKNEYEEAEGKKKQHHDNAAHHGDHEEHAHGQKGAKFDEKKGHKKGHKTKGYHNKYHKDEFHKEHKFYDDYHKGGSHHRYGKFHAKHSSNEGGKKKAHHLDAAHDAQHKGNKGFSNKGFVDSDHRGHKGKQGHEEHHAHQDAYGKKGGGEGGSKWAYKKN